MLLAASAAAALAACGNDDGNTDGAGGGGADGSGGSSEGGSSSGGAATGGTASGGASTGGSSVGGEGGLGGQGGAPSVPETKEEFVAAYCPTSDPAYVITEGTDSQENYGEVYYNVPSAYVLWAGDDIVNLYQDQTEGSATSPFCFIGGDGDDTFRLYGTSSGSDASNFVGTAPPATFMGGAGADVIEYAVSTQGILTDRYRPPFHFIDFESGVDQIVVDAVPSLVDSTFGVDGVTFIDNFGPTSSAEYSSSGNYALVVDPVDGEIWLSTYYESQINVLIGIVTGDTLESGDVIVYDPPT